MGRDKELVDKVCKSFSRNDCPDRILDNIVSGLVAGLVGGAVITAVSGVLKKNTVSRTAQTIITRAPVISVSVGLVLAVYTAFECTVEILRDKKDEANSFIAGAATGALLGSFAIPGMTAARECCSAPSSASAKGPMAILANAAIGAVAFGVLDGILRKQLCEKK